MLGEEKNSNAATQNLTFRLEESYAVMSFKLPGLKRSHLSQCGGLFVLLMVSIFLSACSKSEVKLSPQYHPSVPEAYKLANFKADWTSTYDLTPKTEVTALTDLIAKADGDFNWAGLWEAFATDELRQPRSKDAEDILLSNDVPKCGAGATDGFIDFVTKSYGQSEMAKSGLCYSINPSCLRQSSSNSLENLGKLLMDKTAMETSLCDQNQDQLFLDYLDALSVHPSRHDVFSGLDWETYFSEVVHQPQLSGFDQSAIRTFGMIESLETKDQSDTIAQIFRNNIVLSPSSIQVMFNRFGFGLMYKNLSSEDYLKAFKQLEPNEKVDIVRALSILDLNKLESDELASSLQLISLYSDLLDFDELTDLKALSFIDLYNQNLVGLLRKRSKIKRNEILNSIAGISLQSKLWVDWISWHFSDVSDLNIDVPLSSINPLDQIYFYRLRIRQSMGSSIEYRKTLKELCDFYEEIGFANSTITLKAPEQLEGLHGCLSLKNSEEVIDLLSSKEIYLSPDLVILAPSQNISWQSNFEIQGGIFDLSSDSLQPLPVAPLPIEPDDEDNAVAFNIILGINEGAQIHFFPFHFVARKPKAKQFPDPDFIPELLKPAGSIRIFSSEGASDMVVVSDGYDGKPGATPRLGGRGDVSNRITNYRSFIRTEIEPIYRSLGEKFIYTNEMSKKEWKEVVKFIQLNLHKNLRDLVFIDQDFNLLLSESDQIQLSQYLEKLPIPTGAVWQQYCDELSKDPEFMKDRLGEKLSRDTCELAYRLESLSREVVGQILQYADENFFNDQFTQTKDFSVSGMGMSSPGKALSSGSGGDISFVVPNQNNIRMFSLPGIRFRWPIEWNCSEYDGEIGDSGSTSISKYKPDLSSLVTVEGQSR